MTAPTVIPASQFYRDHFPRDLRGRPTVSRVTFYGLLPTVPWAVRIGRSWFVDPDRFDQWFTAGGGGLPGGWRREAPEPFVGNGRG